MRWLVQGNLPPAVRDALVRHGHTAETAGGVVGDQAVDYDELLSLVRRTQRDLITADAGLVRRLLDKPARLGRCVVHLQLTGGDIDQDDAIDRLFARYKSPKPDMLYTVTETRVKVRQLPTTVSRTED